MAVISTGNHPKALWPGVHAWWGRKYGEHGKEYLDLFEQANSNKNYEEDVGVTGFGAAPQKAEGSSTTYVSETQAYTKRYVNIAYSLGFIVTREEVADCLYATVGKRRAESLAFSMATTKNVVGANVYNRAFNSAYTGGDGKEMCATDHPTISGDQANELSAGVDLSEAALEDLIILIMGATGPSGLEIELMPQSLHVHRNDWFEANRILKSVLQNDTNDNAINALKSTNAIPKGIKMNHYFSDTDAWFIRTNCPHGPMLFEREPIEFTKDGDFDTDNFKHKSYERYSFGWTDWRGVYGSPGI